MQSNERNATASLQCKIPQDSLRQIGALARLAGQSNREYVALLIEKHLQANRVKLTKTK